MNTVIANKGVITHMAKGRGNLYLNPPQDHGQQSEKRIAVKLGAKLTRASGALDFDKSDMVLKSSESYEWRIESKSTIKQSMVLKKDWLKKISIEARDTKMLPALTISFVDSIGNAKEIDEFVLIPMRIFKELFGRNKE